MDSRLGRCPSATREAASIGNRDEGLQLIKIERRFINPIHH
jgi:hypothetical protein